MNIQLSWTEYKQICIIEKDKPVQYVDNGTWYYIWAPEKTITYWLEISKEVPRSADQIDFEDNYLADANALVDTSIVSSSGEYIIPITADEPLEVIATDTRLGDVYNKVLAVPKLTETTIVDYTVPISGEYLFTRGRATGDTDAEYYLQIDGSYQDSFRTSWCERTAIFDLPQGSLSVPGGSNIRIRVYHEEDTTKHGNVDFWGTIGGATSSGTFTG